MGDGLIHRGEQKTEKASHIKTRAERDSSKQLCRRLDDIRSGGQISVKWRALDAEGLDVALTGWTPGASSLFGHKEQLFLPCANTTFLVPLAFVIACPLEERERQGLDAAF